MKVPRGKNKLYTLNIQIGQHFCLLGSITEVAWFWHAQYGHLNFDALRSLAAHSMVDGLPLVKHMDRVSDGCLVGKQHRASFPKQSTYRAGACLELVHVDLCGPISLPTPSGNRYFILIVDDKSMFMWVALLKNKDQAFMAF